MTRLTTTALCTRLARRGAAALLLIMLAGAASAQTQPDRSAERNARRQQLQLQNLQQQVQETQAAKAQAEAAKAEAEKRLQGQQRELPKLQGALRKASDGLKAAEAERDTLATQVEELRKQLAAAESLAGEKRMATDAALAARDKEIERQRQTAGARDATIAQLEAGLGDQTRLVGECTDKNQRLVKLGAELLTRWRDKGLRDVVRQTEPVLGLGDVQMFNLVQDYRDRTEAERFNPGASRASP
jgi:chromosome segregation ATPase